MNRFCEQMYFDEDYNDFLDSYSFKDKDEIYTNGSMLIPTFRAKQGMEHYVNKAKADMVDVLVNFFQDEPCNYGGMDELSDCEYCRTNCFHHSVRECWENAIENRWDLKELEKRK